MRAARRRSTLTTALVAALALGPLAVLPSVAAPDVPAPVSTSSSSTDSTTAPSITGELAVGRTVTAVSGGWAEGTALSYQWLADGAPIGGAQAESLALTSAHAGKLLEVAVTGRLTGQEPTTVTSTDGLRVATTATPVVSGTTAVGSTLKAAPGTWTAGTSFTYQWLSDGAPIPGATGSSLVLAAGQSGRAVSVTVTGSKAGYQTLQRTSAVAPLRVMAWATPTITGVVAAGSTLTARPGTWTGGTTYTYQWYAGSAAISGAKASTFKLTNAQKGKTVKVRVTGAKGGHTIVAKTSASTAKVATAPSPTVTGTAIAGSTLTARPGTWTSGTKWTYRWYADGVAISGATTSTFKLTSAQRDKKVQVKVTGKKAGYATVTKASSPTLKVQTAPTPTIAGSAKVASTLRVNRGTWSSGTAFAYQWYANGKAISGAKSSTMKLSTSRVGQKITVKVTGRKSGYPTASRTSKATSAVTYPNVTAPVSSWNCPSWAPIKGNASSMIYHVRSGAYYAKTKPEDCFRTEAAAKAAGYRKSKR